MPANVEIKARCDDLDALRRRLEGQVVRERHELVQTDTFFHAPDGRLKLREFADGSAELIGYRRDDSSGPKHSDYEKVSVSDPAALLRALEMTLGVRGVVAKRREVLIVGQTRVHLDEVTGLGGFVELEVMLRDDQAQSDGERIANEFLALLGIDDQALIAVAYIDLLEGASAPEKTPGHARAS